MMHFSGSKTANCLQQRLARNPVHSPPALRALDLQVCPHTTLSPHKKPVLTCVNTGLTCMLYGAPSLHALTCMLCGARNPARRGSDLLARSRILAALPDLHTARSHPAPAARSNAATCTYAKRSTPSLETRAKNSGSSSGAFSPKTRASRKMRSPSSRRLSSPVRSVAITSPFST